MTVVIGFLILATVTNAIAMRLNLKQADALEAREHSLGIRSRWLEKRRRLVDERRLRCLAFERLLEMRANRLGVDPDNGMRRGARA